MVVLQRSQHKLPTGRGLPVKESILADYKDGNTRIIICGDFLPKSSEESERNNQAVANAVWSIVDDLAKKGIGEGRVWVREDGKVTGNDTNN